MGKAPTVSIVLPVLHEAETINETLAHIRAADPGAAEIIIVDGDLLGSTISAVRNSGVITANSSKGRARQMNHGAALASGGILLFLHADTQLPANALSMIKKVMEDRRLVAGAFKLGIRSERRIFRITEKYVSLRTRVTRIPFGDQAIFIRRDYFEKIGGYKDIPLMEDVELMARIKKQGDRISIIPEKVLTSARRWEREGVLRCTARNWAIQTLYACGVPPERLAKWYTS
jgi:rSAM/selenodomain-associated transferase 2